MRDPRGTPLNHRLAQYLITGLRQEFTATRGILFDMHRQPLHLQEQMRVAAAPSKDAKDAAPGERVEPAPAVASLPPADRPSPDEHGEPSLGAPI